MRVAIDARMPDGRYGGVQQTVFGLATGLSRLHTDTQYVFLVGSDHAWLEPAIGGQCTLLQVHDKSELYAAADRWRRWPTAGKVTVRLQGVWEDEVRLERLLRQEGIDVVHLMWQRGFVTSRPTLWHPHDLQHIHHPQFFDLPTRMYRRIHYRRMARRATRVGVMTEQGAEDVVAHLGVDPQRIVIVPWAPVIGMDADGTTTPERPEGLPQRYMLFPGKTWPHKNHLSLIRALALLRHEYGIDVPVVLTGGHTEHWNTITEEMQRLHVEDLVHPLGFVTPEALVGLYLAAWAVVFPTLYEGWGLPAVEAMHLGVPLLCSAIEPLVELTGGAALTFDPLSSGSIAATIHRIWNDPEERARRAQAARKQAATLSWDRTARTCDAIYRHMASMTLSSEEQTLYKSSLFVAGQARRQGFSGAVGSRQG